MHSLVLERTESNLSKISWLHGIILLIIIVMVSYGRFLLCHTPIRLISAFQDQILFFIVGCVTTWSWGSHQYQIYCHILIPNNDLTHLYPLKVCWFRRVFFILLLSYSCTLYSIFLAIRKCVTPESIKTWIDWETNKNLPFTTSKIALIYS